jgi:uncharacterized protein (DUF924 family)
MIREGAMGAAVSLREDFSAGELRDLAKRSEDAGQVRRLLSLAAVLVLDQMSRNMFRDTPRAFATDPQALWVAEAAIVQGFDAGLTKDQRMFLYLLFEHSEDRQSQARSVALMASLGDPELQKWAEAHRAIVDRFGRFPHHNGVLGRISTPDESTLG